jgi:DNA topoisomerase-1
VFPPLIESYENGTLYPYLKKVKNILPAAGDTSLNVDEKVLLSYLKNERKKKMAKAA